MTGEDFDVSNLPYDEILKMNILSKIPYYKSEGINYILHFVLHLASLFHPHIKQHFCSPAKLSASFSFLLIPKCVYRF